MYCSGINTLSSFDFLLGPLFATVSLRVMVVLLVVVVLLALLDDCKNRAASRSSSASRRIRDSSDVLDAGNNLFPQLNKAASFSSCSAVMLPPLAATFL